MITSAANQQIKELKSLLTRPRERAKTGCFVAEGIRMVSETPPERIAALYLSESFEKKCREQSMLPPDLLEKAVTVQDRILQSVSPEKTPQGILAVVQGRENTLAELTAGPAPLILALENIQDPGNLGTMLRTGEGAGVSGVLMSRDTVDLYNPKTVRSTMGSLYRVKHARSASLAEDIRFMQAAGIRVYAAYLGCSREYDLPDYTGPTAFLIGNEGNGLKQETAALADERIRIPMAGQLESLNAAAAASILLYEAARQRRAQGKR